ncbi:MAG: hypothetical protein BGO69_01660 [Bacteroidetes bacterium 46-16]|jgi:2Fe-2S ferredoxin|nr:MAG: hypothetical protein BGO69_01660 [Bacteroidetes bacterium 46-16]
MINAYDTIRIKIFWGEEEYVISTYRNEYRSLMELVNDRLYPDAFGECGGMGRCATCLIHLGSAKEIPGMERNETSTLYKRGITDPSIRLSCQILIDVLLHNRTITILDNN